MSITFYFAPMSTASATQCVLSELNLEFIPKQIDIDTGDTRKDSFLKLNPNGRVPVLIHDGTEIWESAAITIYLGETFGESKNLFPKPGPNKAKAMQWIIWSNTTLAEAAGRLSASLPPDVEGAVQSGSQDFMECSVGDKAALERARSDIENCFNILDQELKDKEFILENYSLVDTHTFVFAAWISAMGVSPEPYSHLTKWMQRCESREAIMKVFAN